LVRKAIFCNQTKGKHIQRLGAAEFAPNKETVRQLAYQFAQKLGVSRRLPHQQEMAGYAWLASLLERNLEVSI
jgi:hypothetical protein